MEKQICHLVNKLMEIFDVDEPDRGKIWSERLILSARLGDHQIKPIGVSINEIQAHRGDSGIRELYDQLQASDRGLRGADAILHLASKLVLDNNTRKFIRIHSILRDAKSGKKQKSVPPPQSSSSAPSGSNATPILNSALPPQASPSVHKIPQHEHIKQQYQHQDHLNNHSIHHHNQQPNNFPQNHQPIQHIHHHLNHQQYNNNQATPQQSYSQPQNPPSSIKFHQPPIQTQQPFPQSYTNIQPHNLSTSMVAITPSTQKWKREKRERKHRKNDKLYQNMKAFLGENQFLSFDFKKIDWTQVPHIAPLSSMTPQQQESALINDLLYVLIGTEGKYIRMQLSRESPTKHTIGVERGGDELVYTLATRIIKICPLYSTVVHYAEDVNFGLVNQALAAPVRDLVKEYLQLISNLQIKALKDDMTLQSMWLSLQTIYNRMEALKQILDQISKNSCYGGHTLSVLHNRIINFSTDPGTHEFCLKLMKAASEPYFEILERWLYLGVIEDPYGEFFIEDTENKDDQPLGNIFASNRANNNNHQNQHHIDIDAFWRRRFNRQDSKVPDFLRLKQEKILDTGKYISVVRRYGKKVFKSLRYEPITYWTEQRKYDERVEEAYKFASQELLELLLVENKLIDRLYSLKRYFLFSSGDFFVQFMDMADEELSKTKDDISMTRLASLLELALRTSSCNNDPYKDDVHIKMSDGTLYQIMESINCTNPTSIDNEKSRQEFCHSSDGLFGWESLSLSYDVPWPLSMIICKDYCQTLYQMMFRHLFCCKFIERKLEATWRINRLLKFQNYGGAFALRHKMLHFVHNLLYYITEIIEPSFQILISKFKDGGIENVNELIELHRAFLSGLVHESMLTDNELLGHVKKLLESCMDFSVVVEASFASDSPSHGEVFQSRITDINVKFESRLMTLLKALALRSQDFTASSKLQNIFYRLDFNNFYTKNLVVQDDSGFTNI